MDLPGKSELALSLLRLLPVGDGDDGSSKCRHAPPKLQVHCEGRNGEPEGRLPVKAARSGGGVCTGAELSDCCSVKLLGLLSNGKEEKKQRGDEKNTAGQRRIQSVLPAASNDMHGYRIISKVLWFKGKISGRFC
ncbi:hypothetical protein TgHK011_006488 [Trichoderma gracile]|nr:hypothetical protein TgHK011_006488 [Trichoderma gracile]